MASGHEPPYLAAAMNKLNGRIDDNGVHERLVFYNIARVGPIVHENVQSYCEATDLLSTDSKTAAIAR